MVHTVVYKMFVHFSLYFILISASVSTVIRLPVVTFSTNDHFILEPVESVKNEISPWLDHFKDFIELIDKEELLETFTRFIDDAEVMKFVGFLLSPKLKDIVWEIEIMEEFQEGFIFLKEKGYDMQSVIDAVNSGLHLPPFKPEPSLRYDKGVSGFIAAFVGTLPFEDIKELFNNKMRNSPEFAALWEVMGTEEFMNISRRIFANQKFSEIKTIFESYGVDFKFIYEIFNEVFGVNYEGASCSNKDSSIVKTVSLM